MCEASPQLPGRDGPITMLTNEIMIIFMIPKNELIDNDRLRNEIKLYS